MKIGAWKRMTTAMLSSALVAGLAVAPVSAAEYSIDEPVTIKVLWCQAPTESGLEDTIEEALAETYPNISVDWELITWEDLPGKMQQYMQSGMPDVVIAKSQDANNFAEYDVWADLSDTDYIKNVYESALYGVTLDDKILGMPYIGSYGGVYYNRTIFEELGLEVPTTYEELEEVCKVIAENGITPIGTHFLDAWYHGWAMAIACGGELMTTSETWGNEFRDGTRDAADEDFIAGLEGFQLIHDYTWEDCYSVEQMTCDARFVQGESAMQFDMSGVAAVDYRVTAQAPYPAAVCDVKQAIRFLKAHSGEFGIDKEHIAVMGESAGGYLAAMAGVNDPAYDTGDWLGESSAVQAVIDYYGVADLKVTGNDPACDRQIAEFAGSSDPAALEQASPVYRVGPDAPPFLIFHGDSDQLVPISESEALYEALIRQGVRADFYVVEGEEHGADAFYQPNIREIICGFLDEVFRK